MNKKTKNSFAKKTFKAVVVDPYNKSAIAASFTIFSLCFTFLLLAFLVIGGSGVLNDVIGLKKACGILVNLDFPKEEKDYSSRFSIAIFRKNEGVDRFQATSSSLPKEQWLDLRGERVCLFYFSEINGESVVKEAKTAGHYLFRYTDEQKRRIYKFFLFFLVLNGIWFLFLAFVCLRRYKKYYPE